MTTFLVVTVIVLAIALVVTGVQSKQNANRAQRCCESARQLEQDKLCLISQVNNLKAESKKLHESINAQAIAITEIKGNFEVAKQNLQDLQVAYENVAKDFDALKQKEDARKAQWAAARAKKKQLRESKCSLLKEADEYLERESKQTDEQSNEIKEK